MTTEIATVTVFAELRADNGMMYWQRYTAVGSDHDAAAAEAVDAMRNVTLYRLVTFDGQPTHEYTVGAVPVKARKVEVIEREARR